MFVRHSPALFIIAALGLATSGCFPLVPGGTTMMLKTKAPPARIEVTDFDLPYYGDRTRVAWWSEEPVWGKVTHARRDDGRWEITRSTTNLPMVRVWVDETVTGRDCRWASMQMQQVQVASGANDYAIRTSDTGIDTTFVDHQYTWDCEKIKASVADDPRYKGTMVKE